MNPHLECPVIPFVATSGLCEILALMESEFRTQQSSRKHASAAGHEQGPAGKVKFQATGPPFNLKDFLSISCQWQHYTGTHHRQWNQSLFLDCFPHGSTGLIMRYLYRMERQTSEQTGCLPSACKVLSRLQGIQKRDWTSVNHSVVTV